MALDSPDKNRSSRLGNAMRAAALAGMTLTTPAATDAAAAEPLKTEQVEPQQEAALQMELKKSLTEKMGNIKSSIASLRSEMIDFPRKPADPDRDGIRRGMSMDNEVPSDQARVTDVMGRLVQIPRKLKSMGVEVEEFMGHHQGVNLDEKFAYVLRVSRMADLNGSTYNLNSGPYASRIEPYNVNRLLSLYAEWAHEMERALEYKGLR